MSSIESRQQAIEALHKILAQLQEVSRPWNWVTDHAELQHGNGDTVCDAISEGAKMAAYAATDFATAIGLLEARQRKERRSAS